MDVGGEGHLAERAGRRALGPAGRGLLLGLAYGGRRLRTSLYPTRWARFWVAELGREVQPLSWECVAFLEGPSGWPRRLEVLHGGLRSCKASPFVFSLEVTARKAMDKAPGPRGTMLE